MKYLSAILTASALIAGPSWADDLPAPPDELAAAEYQQVCAAHSVTVFFAHTDTSISPSALRALEATVDMIDDCAITQIQTSAISTDADSGTGMMLLSEARTDSVLESIAATGLWAPDVQTDIVAARDTNRPDTATEPIQRRVEVTLLTVPAITS